MTHEWTVTLHPDPPGIHTWGVWAGLAELDHRGVIRLRIADLRAPLGPGLWIEIADHETADRRIVHVDTSDGPALWCPERAASADSVWKRSPSDPAHRPLGLVSGIRSGRERRVGYALAGARSAVRARDPRRLVSVVRGLSRAGDQPLTRALETEDRGEPCVLFQTRAWDPRGGGDPTDRQRVSDERAALIRVLRRRLGSRFRGGFTDEPAARALYADLVSDLPHDRHGFLRLVPRCAIGVSTVGLHGSNPWKLVEYLALGRAIVSEPLRFAVPETIGSAVSWFTTPDVCAERCLALLDDDVALADAQDAAQAYWNEAVRPDRLVLNRLREERIGR